MARSSWRTRLAKSLTSETLPMPASTSSPTPWSHPAVTQMSEENFRSSAFQPKLTKPMLARCSSSRPVHCRRTSGVLMNMGGRPPRSSRRRRAARRRAPSVSTHTSASARARAVIRGRGAAFTAGAPQRPGRAARNPRRRPPRPAASARSRRRREAPSRSSPRAAAKPFSDWRSILRRWPKAAWVSAREHAGVARVRRLPGHEFDDARDDLGRRREGGRGDVEQNARAGAPAGEHREPPVVRPLGRGGCDAQRHLALEHENEPVEERRPRLRLEPAGQERACRCCRAGWRRCGSARPPPSR